MTRKKILAHLSVLCAVIMFGLNVPALKYLMADTLTPIEATLLRVVIPAILFWVVSFFTKKEHLERRELVRMLVLGVVGLFSFSFFYNVAINIGSPIDVSLMLTLAPVIVTLVSVFFYHSPLFATKILGVVSTLAGATLIIVCGQGGGKNSEPLGVLYAFIAISFYSGYLIGIDELAKKYSAITLLKWGFTSAALFGLAVGGWSIPSAHIWSQPNIMPYLISSFVALFPTFLAFLLIPYGIKFIGVERVSVYQNLVPLVASIAAISLGQAHLRWDQPVAAVFIFLGIYLSSLPKK